MSEAHWERVLAAAGFPFVAALALAAALDARSADAYLLGLASLFFVPFLGALRARLRGMEGETSPLSAVAVIAGSVAAAFYALLATVYAIELEGEVGADIASLVFGTAFSHVALLAAASLVMIRTGVVSRTLGLAGLLLVPVELAATAVLLWGDDEALGVGLAFFPLCAWVLAASARIAGGGGAGDEARAAVAPDLRDRSGRPG